MPARTFVLGDRICVDARRHFMDAPKYVAVTFLVWAWDRTRPLRGMLPDAIVRADEPISAPLLESVTGSVYRVIAPDICMFYRYCRSRQCDIASRNI